jgi:hypothetical protein
MTPFQGRLLHVLPAKRKPGEDLEEKQDNQVGLQYKVQCIYVRIIIIITRVSGQVHCAYSCKSTLVQDKQDTTRRPVT